MHGANCPAILSTVKGLRANGKPVSLLIGALCIFALGLAALGGGSPLSRHMLSHILLMGVLAPAAAWLIMSSARQRLPLAGALLPATTLQLAVLWAWHAPGVLEWSMSRPEVHLVMQASLFLASLWFWLAVFVQRNGARWRSILALLITAKLFCLLGVLLTFAQRALYASNHGAPMAAGHSLADQQLAGLLMLAACPMIYLVAGVVIASRWLVELGTKPAWLGERPADLSG